MSTATQRIEEVGRAVGMDEWEPDDAGAYAIVFDGKLEIELVPLGETKFLLRTPLPATPDDPREREALLKACLQRSFVHLQVGAGAVTFDGASKRLWAFRTVDAATADARAATEALEEFVNLAEAWSRFDAAPASAGFSALPFNMMMRP